uniref:ELMO domain-containing protein n=1 Tax=Pinguiococcus pyrenoidosus TaxID=172671 RepID=A0A7R9Y8H4_9STRA|mmetsp:Transcript_10240/g.38795  ORF Transcript_10240/g.38795 Transcript_10240/m.38795 type:complete len:290 (+) Transcript_10240:448-1317(+)
MTALEYSQEPLHGGALALAEFFGLVTPQDFAEFGRIHPKPILVQQREENWVHKPILEGDINVPVVLEVLHMLRERRAENCKQLDGKETDLLLRLWQSLVPEESADSISAPEADGERRITPSSSWKSLGFQGIDPATDFRSMGGLALRMLVYFAEERTESARTALEMSHRQPAWYPFATAGINIAAFVLHLAQTRALDPLLHAALAVHSATVCFGLGVTEPKSERTEDAEIGMEAIYDLFSDCFEDWAATWAASESTSPMDFPSVFQDFRKRWENRYPQPETREPASGWS